MYVSNWSGNVSETLYSLSTGIRKSCFTRDEKTVMRILRGPFESVCVRGRSTQNWIFFCLAKAFKLAEAGENRPPGRIGRAGSKAEDTINTQKLSANEVTTSKTC